MKKFLAPLSSLLFSSFLPAQLAISEVLVDPVGTNSGKQIIEIVNTTNSAFTPTGWWICSPITYAAFPSIAIPAGGVVQLHIADSGTNSKTDFYFPLYRNLTTSDTFLIYKSAFFLNSNDIVDFVSWGSGTGRIGQAVSVGQWNSRTATVALPNGEGKTISWDGSGDSSGDWVADAQVSLGKPNRIASFSPYGKGCAGRFTPPTLLADVRPALGKTVTITAVNLPPVAFLPTFLIIGFSRTTWSGARLPLDLGFLGAPGCDLLASFDFSLSAGNANVNVKLPVPNQSQLVGIKFYLQSYGTLSGANAANLIVSSALEGVIGN